MRIDIFTLIYVRIASLNIAPWYSNYRACLYHFTLLQYLQGAPLTLHFGTVPARGDPQHIPAWLESIRTSLTLPYPGQALRGVPRCGNPLHSDLCIQQPSRTTQTWPHAGSIPASRWSYYPVNCMTGEGRSCADDGRTQQPASKRKVKLDKIPGTCPGRFLALLTH